MSKTLVPRWSIGVLVALAAIGFVAVVRAESIRSWWLGRKSLEDLRASAKANDGDRVVWSLYAERLLNAGRGEQAAEAYQHAISLVRSGERSASARKLIEDGAYAAARFGTEDQAEALVRRMPAPTGSARAHVAAGVLAMRRKNYAEAQRAFAAATEREPNNAEAHSRLGTCLIALERPDLAENALSRAVELKPADAAVHADYGEALALQSKFKEAMAQYAEAARLAPDNADYATQYALASASAARTDEEYETASTMLVTAMQADPDDAALTLTLAGLQMRFARMDEARRTYETAVGLMGGHPDAWFNLSTVYTRLGDRTSAAYARRRFQELLDRQTAVVEATKQTLAQPRNAKAAARLSLALRRAGDPKGAFRELQRAAALDPTNPRLRETLRQATEAMSRAGARPVGGAN